MSVSTIQTNLSALLNKAYNTGSSDAISQLAKETTASPESTESSSASSQVTLSGADSTAATYTAKGLMQQLRQYQLSNATLIFGNGDDSNEDTTGLTGLTGLMGGSSNTEQEGMSEDWVAAISENPGKAAVMVASTKSSTLNTILGND